MDKIQGAPRKFWKCGFLFSDSHNFRKEKINLVRHQRHWTDLITEVHLLQCSTLAIQSGFGELLAMRYTGLLQQAPGLHGLRASQLLTYMMQ